MQQQVKKSLGFMKTTALGGVIFLLPLAVVAFVLGNVVQVVLLVAEALRPWMPVQTVGGITLLIALAVGLLLLVCFLAGLAARRAIGKRFSQKIEKQLLMLYPRYAIFKDQMAGSIGGDETKPHLKSVLAHWNDAARIAFEVDRTETGVVAVFLPGSPDPWSGCVLYLPADQVQPLEIEFSEAVAICERLGRDSARFVAGQVPRSHAKPPPA